MRIICDNIGMVTKGGVIPRRTKRIKEYIPRETASVSLCQRAACTVPSGILTISDASGREVLHKKLPPQTDSHTIMLTAYPKGVYFGVVE